MLNFAKDLAAQQKTIADADKSQSTRDAQLTQTLTQITSAKQKVQTPTQAANALPQAVSQLIATEPSGKTLPSPITIELPPANGSANSGATNSIAAKTDLENREGTVTSQKGSSAQQSTGSASQQSASSILINVAEQAKSASNAQTNSPPQASANSNGNSPPRDGTSTQNNSALPPAIIRVPQEDLKPLYDAVEDCQACQARLAAAQGDLSDERTKFAAATAERDAAISAAHGTFWKRARTAAKWVIVGAAAGAVLSRYH